ncbi:MAG: TonB-dependent receptor [Saprospiraceae bacterium]|nr:TonB-dependent receptor [Saprospiraceae bacterium]MBK9721574.1 TonB-dependent receptor [Saprospiraceae bacterium]
MLKSLPLFLCIFTVINVFAQKSDIRGNIYNKNTGEPLGFTSVYLQGSKYGAISDNLGFFNIAAVPKGDYVLFASYIGFDTFKVEISIKGNQIINKQIFLSESSTLLGEVSVSGKKQQARTEVKISTLTVTPKEIKALPSTGGEADIAQYLQIIPGVVSTGDQGGQIYIRGGSPVQNRILLDGMTIFNPFHSIGIFSVFETEVIRSVDVLTGGFPAEYGGRISAIIDMKTREGNKTRTSGLVSASPFIAKALIEGPISKFNENKGGSTSYLLTGKTSFIDQTSKTLYKYAFDSSTSNLPFKFHDFYGKISSIASNGSFLNLFGFNFNDQVNYTGLANLDWDASGGGANFKLIPTNSSLIIGGNIAYSRYLIQLNELNSEPRSSEIKGLQTNIDFTYFGAHSEFKYGVEFDAYSTDFNFTNFLKVPITKNDNNTELAGYLKYRTVLGNWVIDPSIRLQYYASLGKTSIEPRFGVKYNVSNDFRLKAAGGLFTQNLMSSVSERDIVNLFVGFITSPSLIKASHAIFGFEYDLSENTDINVETYFKDFTTLYQLNRNKRSVPESDYTQETGEAYGLDILLKSRWVNWSLWLGYSLGYVNRDDGIQKFPALFDRRHNANIVIDYQFGAGKVWEAGLRWNLGSGFAFTKIQGFFEDNKIPKGLETAFGIENAPIGVIYSDKINSGRLPYYHRLDLSIKRKIVISKTRYFDIVAAVTNAYDRKNIFYFNVIENRRVNQLPVLPSLVVSYHF